MNKVFIPWICVTLVAVVGAFMIFWNVAPTSPTSDGDSYNVSMKNGIQYVTLIAKGGYTPRISTIA